MSVPPILPTESLIGVGDPPGLSVFAIHGATKVVPGACKVCAMPGANSNIRILDMIRFGNVHSLRDANRRLGLIVDRALAGAPQAIRTPGGRFAVVFSAEAVGALIAQASRPRSLADMFPVSELDPPVGPIIITHRPGRTRIVFPALEHSADAKDKTDGDS